MSMTYLLRFLSVAAPRLAALIVLLGLVVFLDFDGPSGLGPPA